MAFERLSSENNGESGPQDPGERWLADVAQLPGFTERDRALLAMIKTHSADTFVVQQRRRQQILDDQKVDIIDHQLEVLRQVFR